ncbi:MAG TPA: TPM domain-containing protein [Spongiibacteraceae bacterium]|jgi:putative membrane protein
MGLLNAAQQQQVADAITAVERKTDAELVTVLARRADRYTYIPILYAAAIALLTPGFIALTPFWLGMWEILFTQWSVFIVLALLLQWPPLLTRVIPTSVKRWRAANLARRQFLEQNLHHTRQHTGVLIFVSEIEHYVEIIADRGIDQHVEQQRWQQIIDVFVAQVRRGETLQGFLQCVQSCGELLQQHVPATDQKNELPNRMIVLD